MNKTDLFRFKWHQLSTEKKKKKKKKKKKRGNTHTEAIQEETKRKERSQEIQKARQRHEQGQFSVGSYRLSPSSRFCYEQSASSENRSGFVAEYQRKQKLVLVPLFDSSNIGRSNVYYIRLKGLMDHGSERNISNEQFLSDNNDRIRDERTNKNGVDALLAMPKSLASASKLRICSARVNGE
ncbi:hypothetical protein B296_00010542 [Ensete ventricosum]|uniref:Uncharacterized protein n=1 Tax=Ensete ventricosum TaxID=4639 RepID=A0A426ZMM0_ENSVE|nr:hypothetical protein B296_00010542 [Ensete ventricosum]